MWATATLEAIMEHWIQRVDALLRGEYTRPEDLRAGRVSASSRRLLAVGIALCGVYGVCVGLYAAIRHESGGLQQVAYAAVKVPALCILTLLVTAPSLYVLSALARSRLNPKHTARLLLASTAVTGAVLASLGPVTVFFTLCTRSYPFMLLLNVTVFAVSGCIGVGFLWAAARAIIDPGGPDTPGPADTSGRRRLRMLLLLWIAIHGIVGAQMGWILRPFVGDPNRPLTFLRETEANVLEGVLDALRYL